MSRQGFGGGSDRGRKPIGTSGIQFVKSSEVLNPNVPNYDNDKHIKSEIKAEGSNNLTPASYAPKSLLSLPLATPSFKTPSQQFNSRPPSGKGGFAGRSGFAGAPSKGPSPNNFRVAPAQPVLSKDEYFRLWKAERSEMLMKFRKLAYEVVSLKSNRPNAIDKVMSASNRVPIRIEFNIEAQYGTSQRGASHFKCFVYAGGVSIASAEGLRKDESKRNAYEAALQSLLMPYLRIDDLDPKTKVLRASSREFTTESPKPCRDFQAENVSLIAPSRRTGEHAVTNHKKKEFSNQHLETNIDVAQKNRRPNEYKPLEDFVIVEPIIPIPDCTSAHTIRRSADFNHMLLEYEYFFKGGERETVRCVCRVENVILADVKSHSKLAARNIAADEGLRKLKESCWIIKTKRAFDADSKISKEEMLNELGDVDTTIKQDNVGHKLLSKMGWSGGGVGKDGSGISTPVEVTSVVNRQGLGLGTHKGITDEFRKKIHDVIEEYAASCNQDDLVFDYTFGLEERLIIHDECRRMNLKSKVKGKGRNRYLRARRKRSVKELFSLIMSSGGETPRYLLVPPGQDCDGGSFVGRTHQGRPDERRSHQGERHEGRSHQGERHEGWSRQGGGPNTSYNRGASSGAANNDDRTNRNRMEMGHSSTFQNPDRGYADGPNCSRGHDSFSRLGTSRQNHSNRDIPMRENQRTCESFQGNQTNSEHRNSGSFQGKFNDGMNRGPFDRQWSGGTMDGTPDTFQRSNQQFRFGTSGNLGPNGSNSGYWQ